MRAALRTADMTCMQKRLLLSISHVLFSRVSGDAFYGKEWRMLSIKMSTNQTKNACNWSLGMQVREGKPTVLIIGFNWQGPCCSKTHRISYATQTSENLTKKKIIINTITVCIAEIYFCVAENSLGWAVKEWRAGAISLAQLQANRDHLEGRIIWRQRLGLCAKRHSFEVVTKIAHMPWATTAD